MVVGFGWVGTVCGSESVQSGFSHLSGSEVGLGTGWATSSRPSLIGPRPPVSSYPC